MWADRRQVILFWADRCWFSFCLITKRVDRELSKDEICVCLLLLLLLVFAAAAVAADVLVGS